MTLGDVNAAGEHISSRVDQRAAIFFGMVNDQRMADRVRVTVIATGIPDSRLTEVAPSIAQVGVKNSNFENKEQTTSLK